MMAIIMAIIIPIPTKTPIMTGPSPCPSPCNGTEEEHWGIFSSLPSSQSFLPSQVLDSSIHSLLKYRNVVHKYKYN